ncbi:MAG: hypothetical protein ACRDPF_09350 [Streptosporangiaceae bacterium]
MNIALGQIEEIIDASVVAPRVEVLLPIGVRHRQLRVRTLLAGMLLTQADHRPAHLIRVRDALIALPEPDQVRLGVLEDWKTGPHLLTYRQTERTFGLAARALEKTTPTGPPRRSSPGSAMTCSRPPSPARSSTPAPRWQWTGPTWKPSPAPRRAAPATAPTPKPPGDTEPAAAPDKIASCSSGTTPRPAP